MEPMDLVAAISAIDRATDAGEPAPSLAALAHLAAATPSALRAGFLTHLGITPKAYADARRAQTFRDALASGATVAEALWGSGYTSTSRVYERHGDLLGMTPAAYRKGAPGESLRYALAPSTLGLVIVGLSERGVCFVAFGESPQDLLGDMEARFPAAEIVPAEPADNELVAAVIALLDHPSRPADLPLDVRGTAFQQQVWRALTTIEPGATVTYAQLAKQIGRPSAVRAVAQACGANPIAVAIPCHRVIGADGSLTGYRWGVERKRVLIGNERTL